ncbi:putative histidine ammonia-lyase [Toxocara canis]|uniref:Histidine ammonia-lyase n=1 Tax=Toxocara canis TaxID=6265 RepID=A0A0B2VFB3_TOXCA|nr:putative histidine ammonia-lyase [Toxocara canis]
MRLQVQLGTECIVVACDEEETIDKATMKGADTEERNDEKMVYISEQLEKQSKRKIRFEYDITPVGLEKPTELLVLDGYSLTTTDLVKCEQGRCIIQLSMDAEDRVRKSRALLEKIVHEHSAVYGVSTGFGTFANVRIPEDKLKQLQLNLIRSHASGYGKPLQPSHVRMLLALRINVLAKGYSGISLPNIKKLIAAFNAFCVSYVPEQGSVGASGDLCPLAHLALGLLGEGKMWSPLTGWDDASIVLKKNKLEKMDLGPKEGLALINGTQMIASIGALALERADQIAKQADVIAALSLDVLKGTTKAYDADVHSIRPHKGQMATALRLRSLLHSEANPSQIAESHRSCGKVQDAYTLRCVPQVHGIVHDTIEFVRSILDVELNSATDNPLVFADRQEIISGGNFHGEYPAKALDYLAIAVHELAQMSERRLERLINHELSGLPTFLTRDGGLNSGFMVVQLCSASLVSENKVLCHPSSADSIPTSCSQEDHVSMGAYAARKALTVVEHVEAVLAMELLAACQGMEFLKPLMSTAPLNKVYNLVRSVSPPVDVDRSLQPDIEKVTELLRQGKVWEVVEPHMVTMEAMEDLDPDALRQYLKTPTGIMIDDSEKPADEGE